MAQPAGSITSMPIAVFIRFAGARMVSEVAFMNTAGAVTRNVPAAGLPAPERLRSLLEEGRGS